MSNPSTSITAGNGRASPLRQAMLEISDRFLDDLPDLKGKYWRDLGVERPFVFMITGRCGSTWLSGMIEDTGLAGIPHEMFAEDAFPHHARDLNAGTICDYIDGIIDAFGRNGSFGFQINPTRFFWLREVLSETNLFDPQEVKWIDMRRQNILAQAYSFARARASGKWHRLAAEKQENTNAPTKLNDALVWNDIIRILDQEIAIEKFYVENRVLPLRLFYEELQDDKYKVLGSVVQYLGATSEQIAPFTGVLEDKTVKLKDLKNKEEEMSFFLRYIPALNHLNRMRDRMNVSEFASEVVRPTLARVNPEHADDFLFG